MHEWIIINRARFLALNPSLAAGKEYHTMPEQLFFDFYEKTPAFDSSSPKDYNPNRVSPTDITYFLATYLPEYREDILSGKLSEGNFKMPCLKAIHNVSPEVLIPFNALMSLKPSIQARFAFFHFFIHDYQFDRIWNNPLQYMPFLKRILYGIGPDFSMFLYMHPAEMIINCCRNRLLAFYFQVNGLNIVPNVCFGDQESLTWAFDGIPEKSVLATGSLGCMEDGVVKQAFLNGLHELDRQKHPELLYVYGLFPEAWKDKFNMEIRTLPTFISKWRRAE